MAPRVHTIKKGQAGSSPAAAPASPPQEEEPPIAQTVSLGDLDDASGNETSDQDGAETPTTEEDFEDNDPDKEQRQSTAEDIEVDDDDLSLLDDEEGGSDQTSLTAEEQPEEGFLEIYRNECLECRELVPFAKKSYKRKGCHFTSGNKNCPAESTTIVIRVPLEEIVPRWIAAEKNCDLGRLSRLTAKLAEKPDWYQQRVMQALEKARKSN